MSSYDFKLVLLGQGCVGKTSLVLRYVSNVFDESHQSTLQASFLKKQLYLDANLIRLNIWDTAGQEKFHALGPIYYRGANGALLVYDVTNPDSLRKVRDWVKELNKMLGRQNVQLAIVGNKVDLVVGTTKQINAPVAEMQQVHSIGHQRKTLADALIQEAVQLADELPNARHYLTSAKLNQGIAEMFVGITKRMVEQHKRLLALQDGKLSGMARSRILRSISVAPEEEEGTGNASPNVLDTKTSRLSSTNGRRDGSCQC